MYPIEAIMYVVWALYFHYVFMTRYKIIIAVYFIYIGMARKPDKSIGMLCPGKYICTYIVPAHTYMYLTSVLMFLHYCSTYVSSK